MRRVDARGLLAFAKAVRGGDQIDYADERPEIRKWFSEALAKNGLQPDMQKAYTAEGQTVA